MPTSTVVASAARTTSGNSGALAVPESPNDEIDLFLDVTAVSGTGPSMTVTVEWSTDGATFFATDTADSFAAVTAAAKKTKAFEVKGDWYRVVWTITGTTPSFTFSVTTDT